jgi:hypothetical protein
MFKKIAAAGSIVTLSIGSALAEVPAGVTTALSDAKSDGVLVATAVLVAVVAIYAFKLMRKGL